MPPVDGDTELLHVFLIEDEYLFKHYFELNEVFEALASYYDADEYRFEVPTGEWEAVVTTLRDYRYEPEVVDDFTDFVVVKAKYTPHAQILKRSVANWNRRGYNFFLLKDPLSVERAIQEHGATPVVETELVVGL